MMPGQLPEVEFCKTNSIFRMTKPKISIHFKIFCFKFNISFDVVLC